MYNLHGDIDQLIMENQIMNRMYATVLTVLMPRSISSECVEVRTLKTNVRTENP